MTTIDCISDLHGEYPELEGGDLLLVAGDLTGSDKLVQWHDFYQWLQRQDYRKKVYIAGNHDKQLQDDEDFPEYELINGIADYLCDSGCEFEGLKIYGTPWTKSFKGMNPHCMAFTVESEGELKEKWKQIPDDVDILITHCAPNGILDKKTPLYSDPYTKWIPKHLGSESLYQRLSGLRNLKLHVFGHIHEGYGLAQGAKGHWEKLFVNASHMNRFYEPENKPVRIFL